MLAAVEGGDWGEREHSTVWYGMARHRTAQCNKPHHSTAQGSAAQCFMVRRGAVRCGTSQQVEGCGVGVWRWLVELNLLKLQQRQRKPCRGANKLYGMIPKYDSSMNKKCSCFIQSETHVSL